MHTQAAEMVMVSPRDDIIILRPPKTELVLNDSSSSTMWIDPKSSCSPQQTNDRPISLWGLRPAKKVRFDTKLHVKEIKHRNDMTENELEEISSFDLYFPDSLFDIEDEESVLERLEHQRQMKLAGKIRQRFLLALRICALYGTDSAVAVQVYSDYSSSLVQEARTRGWKAAQQGQLDGEAAGAVGNDGSRRKRPFWTACRGDSKRIRLVRG